MSDFDEKNGIIRDANGRFAGRVPGPPAAELTDRAAELEATGAVRARSMKVRARSGPPAPSPSWSGASAGRKKVAGA